MPSVFTLFLVIGLNILVNDGTVEIMDLVQLHRDVDVLWAISLSATMIDRRSELGTCQLMSYVPIALHGINRTSVTRGGRWNVCRGGYRAQFARPGKTVCDLGILPVRGGSGMAQVAGSEIN